MKILGTGLNGLIGSRVTKLLQHTFEFKNISRSTGVDITDGNLVMSAIEKSDAPMVLHMVAKTDVDGCEEDKEEDIKILNEQALFLSKGNLDSNKVIENIKNSAKRFRRMQTAWAVNVAGTQNIVDACKKTSKKLTYISTDYVFDGEKTSGEFYEEEDTPDPINWYGMTKYIGEVLIRNSGIPFLIIRPAYPYGLPNPKKKDFVQAILGRLREGKNIAGVTDHLFVPTYIDDIAKALNILIASHADGVYHVVGDQSLTPYDASVIIADMFGIDKRSVSETTREIFFSGRAPTPYNLMLKNDKIERLGVKMKGFEEGLRELKVQS